MGVINLKTEQEIRDSVVGLHRNSTVDDALNSGNLFNKSTETPNSYINATTGAVGTLNGYAVSDFIPVDRRIYPNLKFMSRNSTTQNVVPYSSSGRTYAAFYDFNKEFLCQALFSATEGATQSECEIPTDAWYIRFTYQASTERNHDALLYYGNKTLGWLDLPYRPVGYIKPDTKNLTPKECLIRGFINVLSGSNYLTSLRATGDETCTSLIPVIPNESYVISEFFRQSDNNTLIYTFNKNREFVRTINLSSYCRGIITIPADIYYISRNYYTGSVDYRDKPFFMYKLSDFELEIGTKIAENEDYIARTTSLIKDNQFACTRIVGLFENHVVFQRYNGGTLYYSNNGIEGNVISIELNSTNFPDIVISSSNPILVEHILFFNSPNGVRSLVFFNNNQIYCSTTGAFEGFEKPNIWDLYGNRYWKIDENSEDKSPSGTRYRKHYPTDLNSGNRKTAFMWHNGPVWTDGQGGQFANGVMFVNYTDAYTTKPSPSCLFYTKDGKNIYVQYEFGVYQKKYKLAGDDTEQSSVNYGLGDDVTPSSMSGSLTNVTIKKRWNILPTESIPHPEEANDAQGSERAAKIFDYSEAVTVNSISGEQFVLSDASDFNIGDTVVLQGTATEDFAKMLNNDASETEGGNVVFVVKSKSGNNITLADAIGNPKNNLMCRHIHGVAEFGQGVCIYTGEEYPESWYIYLAPLLDITNDGTDLDDPRWRSSVVRLNSSKNAFQRSLGVYLRPDGKMVYVADSNAPFIKKAEALGKDIKMGGHGVFVTDIANLNDPTNNLSKIDAVNDIYCLYKLGNILFISDYSGNTYYSKDEGDTWKFICKGVGYKNLLVGFDKFKRRFVFNNSIMGQFVMELK